MREFTELCLHHSSKQKTKQMLILITNRVQAISVLFCDRAHSTGNRALGLQAPTSLPSLPPAHHCGINPAGTARVVLSLHGQRKQMCSQHKLSHTIFESALIMAR